MTMNRNEMLTGAAAGAVIGVIYLATSGGITHNEPERSVFVQEKADACSKTLPDATQQDEPVGILSTPCTYFAKDFIPTGTGALYIMSQDQFENIIEEDYTTKHWPYPARLGTAALITAGPGGVILGIAAELINEYRDERKSRFAGNIAIRRRIGANVKSYNDGLPIDCLANKGILDARAKQLAKRGKPRA